ncbi:hypothetical protein [Gluconobacter cerinus]|uniref:hypothetical protein n=1 Tax=Gluconobacter cerinus TaxID=38307 RepID=UPI001B8BA183|nr:hypothetical protein [Gluconobacter cerinus]MBS1068836.1 hypothetical protein [Gluconobacter cerinus]
MILNSQGKNLLKILIPYLDCVNIRTDRVLDCPTYSEILQQVVPTWIPAPGDDAGKLLKPRGLDDLANWTKARGLPGITGLIVRKDTKDPGEGYYNLIRDTKIPTWVENIRESKHIDWKQFL